MRFFESETYSEHCRLSEMVRFAKLVSSFQPLTIFAKRSIFDNKSLVTKPRNQKILAVILNTRCHKSFIKAFSRILEKTTKRKTFSVTIKHNDTQKERASLSRHNRLLEFIDRRSLGGV